MVFLFNRYGSTKVTSQFPDQNEFHPSLRGTLTIVQSNSDTATHSQLHQPQQHQPQQQLQQQQQHQQQQQQQQQQPQPQQHLLLEPLHLTTGFGYETHLGAAFAPWMPPLLQPPPQPLQQPPPPPSLLALPQALPQATFDAARDETDLAVE